MGFRVNSDNSQVLIHLVNNSSGVAYFDNIQLVNGYKDTRKNIVNDGSFELGETNYWYLSTNTSYYDLSPDETGVYKNILGEKCIKINGLPYQNSFALANIRENLDSTANKTLVIGGWAKAEGATPTTYKEIDRYFRINVTLFDVDDNNRIIGQYYIDFDPNVEGWQYICREVNTYSSTNLDIRLYLEYLGEGTVYFDGIQVYEEKFGSTYSYDELGRVEDIYEEGNKKTSIDYNNDEDNRIDRVEVTVDGETIKDIETECLDSDLPLEISGINFNNVKAGIDYNYDYYYDQFITLSSKTITIGDTGKYFTLSTKYNLRNGFGQYIDYKTDEFGNRTTYYYDILSGLLKAIEDAKGEDIHYLYDNEGKLIDVIRLTDYTKYNENNPSTYHQRVKYQYDSQDRLSKIIIDNNYYYEIIYDNQNRIKNVKVNSISLASYTYLMKNGYYTNLIANQTYGNGDVINFIYNEKDLVTSI